MSDVQIPADRIIKPRFRGAPLSQDGMHRVFEKVLRRHLYQGPIPLEEMLAMDDPRQAQSAGGRRQQPRIADTPTEFDLIARYEMRYTDALATSELGVVGYCDEELFSRSIEWMWQQEWATLGGPNGEQPGGEWQMVACAIRQQDLSVQVPVTGEAPDEAAMIRKMDGENPRSIRLDGSGAGGIAGYREGVATRWVCPMVFVDVSRSELRDPARGPSFGVMRDNPTSALTEYILTRQMRHMTPTMRANRKLGTALIEEFMDRSRSFETESVIREAQRLAPEQVSSAREAVANGMPEALLAQTMGISLESLRRALDGAMVPTAK